MEILKYMHKTFKISYPTRMKMETFELRMHDNSDFEKTACKFFLKKINFG